MNDEGGGCLGTLLIVAAVAAWLWLGNGWATVRQWTGQATYEDQRDALAKQVAKGRVGSSSDVWLVKYNLGIEDRVALFFGYLDDWETCFEFAEMYMQRYPLDRYGCTYAN